MINNRVAAKEYANKIQSHSENRIREYSYCSAFPTREELVEYFHSLAEKSRKRKIAVCKKMSECEFNDVSTEMGLYKSHQAAEYIFMLCGKWNLDDEVKYISLEIFDRFMSCLISQLYAIINEKCLGSATPSSCTSSTNSSTSSCCRDSDANANKKISSSSKKTWLNAAEREWRRTVAHLKGQMELRACTCIMIASKICSHYETITINRVCQYLNENGHHYKKEVLWKSEMRILKSIDYHIHSLPSLYPYVAVLLGLLEPHCLREELYSICIKLLDLFYYFRSTIYSRLCKLPANASANVNTLTIRNFCEVMNDLVLSSAALVTAAASLRDKTLVDQVTHLISKITEIPCWRISEFSSVILDVTLPTSSPTTSRK